MIMMMDTSNVPLVSSAPKPPLPSPPPPATHHHHPHHHHHHHHNHFDLNHSRESYDEDQHEQITHQNTTTEQHHQPPLISSSSSTSSAPIMALLPDTESELAESPKAFVGGGGAPSSTFAAQSYFYPSPDVPRPTEAIALSQDESSRTKFSNISNNNSADEADTSLMQCHDVNRTESEYLESITDHGTPNIAAALLQSPSVDGLEKISKFFSGPSISSEDGVANASQLLAAAVAAATVAASGNVAELSPQEQWLASMAPTLIQMISQDANNQSATTDSMDSSNDEDSISNAFSSESSSLAIGKRRKQSKPVRYQNSSGPSTTVVITPFQASIGNSSKRKSSKKERKNSGPILPIERLPQKLLHSTSTLPDNRTAEEGECDDHDGDDEEEEEEEEEAPLCGAEAADSSMSDNDDDEECNERVKHSKTESQDDESPTTKSSTTIAAAAPSTAATAEDEDEEEEEDVMREKQQQLLLANMFANLQQKLIQSVFCPQCNCPFANEDQLRAHIEIEHMQKLQFFSEAAAAAAAAAASGGNKNSSEALHLKQIAEHLAMQQKLQDQMERGRRIGGRKRKLNRSPSSRSISSASSNESSNSASDYRKASLEDNNLDSATGTANGDDFDSANRHTPSPRKRSSKDLNHNLLQSLNLPVNLFSPLISSEMSPKSAAASSQQSLLSQHSQQSRLLNSSPHGDPSASPTSSDQPHHRQSPSDASSTLASFFPTSMAPFLFPMLSQSSGSNNGANGVASHQFALSRDHLSSQQPVGSHLNSPQSSAMLNGVAVGGNSSVAAAAAAAANLRIFNPEAYCELCNKEFCNKYFLKTHKANKHGIYTPDSVNERGSCSSNVAEPRHSTVSALSSGMPGSSSLLPPSSSGFGLMTPTTISIINGHSNSKTSPNISDHNLFGVGSGSVSSGPQSASTNGPQLMPGFPGGPMRLNLNMNMINLDSYCEICQKEFCNKYFLKKHKQKIHGFMYRGDTAIPQPNLAAQLAQSQQQPLSSIPPHSPSASQLQQLQHLHLLQQQLAAQQQREPELSGNRQSPSADLELKVTSPAPSGHSTTAAIINSLEDGEDSGMKTSSLLNAYDSASAIRTLTPEKLLSIGVNHPDAFCEICCKEFCNKYFLRTHKFNKHGILDGQSIHGKFPANHLLVSNTSSSFPPPLSSSPSCEQELSPKSACATNVNVTDYPSRLFAKALGASSLDGSTVTPTTAANSDDSCLEPGQRDPTSYKNGNDFLSGFTVAADSGIGLKCDLCAVHLPNSYLLKMHKYYVHEIPFSEHVNQPNTSNNGADALNDLSVKCDDKAVDSDTETEVTSVPSMLVTAVLNHESSSQHSISSAKEGQDLQKLHSMIKDLIPNVDADSDGKSVCHVCKFECENRYYLRAHLINEHGFPPTEEAFLQMVNATSAMNLAAEQVTAMQQQQQSDTMNTSSSISSSSEAYCELCNKEFCSKYFLKTHKQKIHNIGLDGSSTPNGVLGSELSAAAAAANLPPALLSSMYQAVSGQKLGLKENSPKFLNSAAMSMPNPNIHATIQAAIAAGLVPNPDQIASFPSKPPQSQSNGSRVTAAVTGRNYCNICNKELCNKYFMKTHMLKMHNINIDEHPIEAQQSSTIGGVTCDICQKELCSKYFLKVHKQNTHGIYEDGATPPVLLGASGATAFGNGRADALQRQQLQQQNAGRKMFLQQNGTIDSEGLSSFNPMMLMSMMQSAAAQATSPDSSDSNSVCSNSSEKDHKINGLDPVADAGNRLLSVYQEVCQLCDRRFKSAKWLRGHIFNEHGEVLQMMRTTGEINQALAQTTGANSENLGRLCFVCGQMFPDRFAVHVHLVKEHKVTEEELALNLAGNLKMAAIMAAAAAAAAQQQQSGSDQLANASDISNVRLSLSEGREESPASRRAQYSRSSTPSSQKSDDIDLKRNPQFNANQSLPSPATALQNFLLKQSGLNSMALFAASQSRGASPWSAGLFGEAPAVKMDSADNQPNQSPSIPSGASNPKNSPGKFVCQICFRNYRHSHSLQRHMISHRPKQPQASRTPPPSSANVSAPTITSPNDNKTDQKSVAPTAGNTAEKPRNKRYRCSKCNKKFRTRELCLVHIRALHSINNNNITTSNKSMNETNNQQLSNNPTHQPATKIVSSSLKSKIAERKLTLKETEIDSELHSFYLKTTLTENSSEHHRLSLSPSASIENDLINASHHRQTEQLSANQLSTKSPSYLPHSPIKNNDGQEGEEEENVPTDLSLSQEKLSPTNETLEQKILILNSNSAEELENSENLDTAINIENLRPSLICINGEKY